MTTLLEPETLEAGIAGLSARQRTVAVTAALVLLCSVGAARIVDTYHVFSQTTDEPAHVVTGIEWLQRGTYTIEPLHPPLARVAVAVGPYLAGRRLSDSATSCVGAHCSVGQFGVAPWGSIWQQGGKILMAPGRYLHILALARLGILPFFLLAVIVVWDWTRRRYGNAAGLVATLLFTTTPSVLAHAGLATTDLPLTAAFIAALAAFTNFMERPSYGRAAVLGVAAGFATLTKFSALLFLPACVVALYLWRWFWQRRAQQPVIREPASWWRRALAVLVLSTTLTVWAGYRFSVGPLTRPVDRPHNALDHVVGARGSLHDAAYAVVESFPVPAPELFHGLVILSDKESGGHKSYLLGHSRFTGWWYFFPVVLAVKTPLALLILVAFGAAHLIGETRRTRDWAPGTPLVAAATILLVCLPSHIDLGVRHILPIFPLFAIVGGVGACRLWRDARSRVASVAVVVLIAWQVIASVGAHPDYLAYFNELAGRHPERILVDSDLDWGQDLLRLSATLREKRVDSLSLAYAGSQGLDLTQFGLPPFRVLPPYEHADGWIAISLTRLKEGGSAGHTDGYSWLEAYQPVYRAGRSIWIYHVPAGSSNSIEPSR